MGNLKVAVVLALVAMLAHPGAAASHRSRPTSSSSRHLTGAPVYMGKKTVMTIYGASRSDAKNKAKSVQERLDQAVKWGIPVSRVSLQKTARVLTVQWGGHLIATIDDVQSEGNRMKPWGLGESWVSSIQRAVNSQTFTVSERSITLGVGEAHTVKMSGGLPGTTRADSSDSTIVAHVNPADQTVTLRADAAASGTVTLVRGTYRIPIKVTARPYAGQIPSTIECVVTGTPASKDVLIDAVLFGLRGSIKLSPGAAIYMKGDPKTPESLLSGKEITLTVPLALEGNGLLPVRKSVAVIVRNRMVEVSDAALLMVSNRPETVEGSGVIFTGKFGPGRPARLFYAHKNATSKTCNLGVTLTNRSEQPATVLLITAPSSPDPSEQAMGSTVTAHFLDRIGHASGVIVTLPPRTGWEIVQHVLAPQTRVMGLCHLQVLSGEAVEVTVASRDSGVPLAVASRNVLPEPANPDHQQPRGVFASPSVSVSADYAAGDPSTDVELGNGPWLVDAGTGESDTGNFGALYTAHLKLTNKENVPHQVLVSYTPGPNANRACLAVDGVIQQTGLVKANSEEIVQTVELAPGQTRSVVVRAIPRPGGGFPLHLLLKTRLPGDVPIAAPSSVAPPTPDGTVTPSKEEGQP